MATYQELLGAVGNKDLSERILVACVVAADIIRLEATGTTNHAARLEWAKATLRNPSAARDSMMYAVLAQNRAVAIGTIVAADDTAVQTAVNAAVDLLAV